MLIAISFHYVSERLCYLGEVLRTLAAFPVEARHIVIVTNRTASGELTRVRGVLEQAGLSERELRIVVASDLHHPYDLTWVHKDLITVEFLTQRNYTHFIYLEDDERLTFENFVYFVRARERPVGLVPSFLRTEWSDKVSNYVSTDSKSVMTLDARPFTAHGNYAYVCADNPLFGLNPILDHELADEYVRSRALFLIRIVAPKLVLGCTRTCGDGIDFLNPPFPFNYRVAVPVSLGSKQTPALRMA